MSRVGINAPAMGQFFETVDKLSSDQLAELHIHLAGNPMAGVDPVRLAFSAYTSLKEEELPLYFEKLQGTMTGELWDILTEKTNCIPSL